MNVLPLTYWLNMLLYAMYVNEIDLFRSIFIPCLDGMMAVVSTHFLYNKYCSRQVMTLPGQNSLHDIGFLQHCLFIFILYGEWKKNVTSSCSDIRVL